MLLYLAIFASAVFSFQGSYSAWKKRDKPSAVPLAIVSLCAGLWAICYAMELASKDLSSKNLWGSLKYLFIVPIPVALASFVLRFAGWQNWPRPGLLVALLAIPMATMVMIFTNDLHHAFWQRAWLETIGALRVRMVTYGAWFWINAVYAYALIIVSSAVAFASLSRLGGTYRRQMLLLAAALSLPLAANLLTLLKIQPFHGIDLSPIAFGLSAVFLLLTTGMGSLLNVVPLAYANLVEQMRDGVLILDAEDRILTLNPAAEQTLKRKRSELLGQALADIDHPILELVRLTKGENTSRREVKAEDPERPRWFEMMIASLTASKGRPIGRIVVWHDISERKKIEAELRHASTHDGLTGLYNRLFFEEELERFRFGRTWPLAVLIADIDDLKATNDNLGHAAGDEMIRQVAQLLRQAVRSEDMVARVGGDEFAVLIPHCDELRSEALTRRLERAIAAHNTNPNSLKVQLSFGCAVARDGTQLEKALQVADHRMYVEKSLHKGTYDLDPG
ncbi:MAG: histidine kinase N-terminal 7TM domain-containing protein [Chloroflexota bacterium]